MSSNIAIVIKFGNRYHFKILLVMLPNLGTSYYGLFLGLFMVLYGCARK